MRRYVGAVLFGLLVAGCATEGSVKKKIDPLAERVTALEKAQAATNAKLDAQSTELAALKQSTADATAASARAEQAAKEAAAAADRADAAAQKSTKAFELSQVKGGKKK